MPALIKGDNMAPEKDIAIAFLTLCAKGQARTAFERYTDHNFIHHNPYFAGNGPALAAGMDDNARQFPDKKCEILRAIAEDDLVAVHSKVTLHRGEKGIAVVHIFRFSAGKIVELWDIGQAVPDNQANEQEMF